MAEKRGGQRPGAGRPRREDARRRRVAVLLRDEEFAELDRLATAEALPLGSVARDLVVGGLRHAAVRLPPPTGPSDRARPRLQAAQEALLDALRERDAQGLPDQPRLAHIYLGALRVLGDQRNPDRLHLAAYNLRELMDFLPRVLNLPTASRPPHIATKARQLESHWAKARSGDCHEGAEWSGEIDGPLRGFLRAADTFFSWFNEDFPTRREEAPRTLRGLDPSPTPPPAHVEERHAAAWVEIYRYFNAATHHKRTEERELRESLAVLEHFLLDRLRPSTFADQDEIDRLLSESG